MIFDLGARLRQKRSFALIMKAIVYFCLCHAGLLCAADTKGRPTLPERVKEFTATHVTAEQVEKRHKEWIATEPDNPDAYILPANALLKISSSVSINSGTDARGFATLVDPKTNEAVGTISNKQDPKLQARAIAILTAATLKFPQRLDMHVGRMAICQQNEDLPGVEQAGLELLQAAEKLGDKMLWTDNAPITTPIEEKVVSEVHPRISWFYSKEKPETDEAASRVALAALKIYPKNVKLLNDAAIFHAYRNEWAKARDYFLQAAAVDPKDMLVQHNIATASLRQGEKAEAIKRWQSIVDQVPGTDEAKAAQSEIDKLKAKPKTKKK
jgi:tetratricopeptide (TPR) repeat protein